MIKKYYIPAIIILMSISLTGIITIQFFYIRNVIAIKEKNFSQAVNNSLSDVSQRLSRDQDVRYISDKLLWDNENGSISINSGDSLVWSDKSSEEEETQSYVFITDKPVEKTISVKSGSNGSLVMMEAARDSTFRYETRIKLDSLKNEIGEEQYTVLNEFQDSVNIIIKNQLNQIDRKSQSLYDLIDDMVLELKTWDKTLIGELDEQRVEKRLQEAFLDNGIELDFEFSIEYSEDRQTEELDSQLSDKTGQNNYSVRLFPDLLFSEPQFLVVRFAGKNVHILRSVALLLLASLFFTLVIILTFYLTIRLILKQKKISEIKSDFINNMTHEFKTPIATISLAADSINNPSVINVPEKVKYFTEIIRDENTRMNSRVENVLQMSLIDQKEFNLSIEQVDVHEMINKTADQFDLQIERSNGKVHMHLNAGDPRIESDPNHLMNILVNLLDNALKYSEKDPEIVFSTFDSSDRIKISVQDNGIGMNREEQQKIFDKFYRVSKGDVHDVKGFGLGLSYVKAIILAMKGSIHVDSQPGKGTKFVVDLPKKQETHVN